MSWEYKVIKDFIQAHAEEAPPLFKISVISFLKGFEDGLKQAKNDTKTDK